MSNESGAFDTSLDPEGRLVSLAAQAAAGYRVCQSRLN